MKKGLSPLVATILLLGCAILLGTLVMNWGRDYIEGFSATAMNGIETTGASPISPIDVSGICKEDPLTLLQTRYVKGEITTAQYLEMKAILTQDNAIAENSITPG